MSHKHHHQAIQFSWVSIIGNLLLFGLKLWAGIVSMSVTLIADAWHTLSDSLSSVIVLIALKISRKPPDDDHPFGHGRSETVASVIVGSMLGFIAFHFLIESIQKLIKAEGAEYGSLAIWVTVVSILVKEVMAQFSIRIGKRNKIWALVADGWHHRSDALSSVLVLVGIFISGSFWWIDGVMGILISVFIGYVAYQVLDSAISALLGEHPGNDLLKKVQEICNSTAKQEVHAHHIHVHDYGDHKEMVFHIRLPEDWSLKRVHDLVDLLEEAVSTELEQQVTIHVDPLRRE
ncbi:MAG: cation transporter [Bacteroidetes bacterium]|nr:cation transporter [Bacteroidota bacterium]